MGILVNFQVNFPFPGVGVTEKIMFIVAILWYQGLKRYEKKQPTLAAAFLL